MPNSRWVNRGILSAYSLPVYVTIQSRCRAALLTTGSLVFLAGCGGPSATPQGGSSGERQRLLLVSYAVTKGAYDRILLDVPRGMAACVDGSCAIAEFQ